MKFEDYGAWALVLDNRRNAYGLEESMKGMRYSISSPIDDNVTGINVLCNKILENTFISGIHNIPDNELIRIINETNSIMSERNSVETMNGNTIEVHFDWGMWRVVDHYMSASYENSCLVEMKNILKHIRAFKNCEMQYGEKTQQCVDALCERIHGTDFNTLRRRIQADLQYEERQEAAEKAAYTAWRDMQ